MRRREFIAGTAAVAAMGFARPVFAQANPSPGAKRLAIFHTTEPIEKLTINGLPAFKAYFAELNRLGHIEGQNLIVDRYSALGQPDRYETLAREIVASRPDVIFPLNVSMVLRINALTTNIPIVMLTGDPVASGLTTNLARPSGNITGVTIDGGFELWGKRFQLLLETAKKLTNVCFLRAGPVRAVGGERQEEVLREAARRAGISLTGILMNEEIDRVAYERTFEKMEKDGVDGLIVQESGEHFTYRQLIVDLAAKVRLPTIYPFREFVEVGGLMAYGIDLVDATRRVADTTNQVLRGVKPSDIPFYQETKYELVLNQKAATSLGLQFSPILLTAADGLIE
jgi:putative tryptophan/tyrosine transport system substrate-binding protein